MFPYHIYLICLIYTSHICQTCPVLHIFDLHISLRSNFKSKLLSSCSIMFLRDPFPNSNESAVSSSDVFWVLHKIWTIWSCNYTLSHSCQSIRLSHHPFQVGLRSFASWWTKHFIFPSNRYFTSKLKIEPRGRLFTMHPMCLTFCMNFDCALSIFTVHNSQWISN